ncbi:MAG: cyclic pyranopterin monophosphate synthase MoaC [Gammaproteobacteria bacterium]|nr:cyclic pyranopterin monophosphate synthase MoaC [Gammaproteobacteria bacterium]MDE0645681.1 cyclic pyranopterin monophosphate synthase MoaC [Gammaproteobacteria bacterium]MXX94205.1 cyclic pyranopterin monophosphate synthase MoaC [Gammaproteobacteria bacterium]MYF52327.1 cyclic pyranopterin monophosphate synthase MoaC [Gammaproteobacteria bacterium]MYK42844.1 cyclic pyranopterin monophosphate synthase MoaC [Gammaproteobacteria bacterium]
MSKLSHVDSSGKVSMVDISTKQQTAREASAEAFLTMKSTTMDLILTDKIPKGDVLATARIAAIQAAKKTSELIPLCHPLSLSHVQVDFERVDQQTLRIETCCRVHGRTGVEMETLTATAIAALTVYDMIKSVEKGVVIECVQLVSKSGGKSGTWNR